MKSLLMTLLCFSTHYLFASAMHGGSYVSVEQLPYIAQLYVTFPNGMITFCGAAIISEYWLVSAAHCVGKDVVTKWEIRIGSSSTAAMGTLIDIEEIIVHGSYETDSLYDNDICLIKVKTPIVFNEYAQPIEVAREPPQSGDYIIVSGFGYDHFFIGGKVLKTGYMSVITNEQCLKSNKVTNNMFCVDTKKIDLCFGDSGSPSVLNDKLVGIASQGCNFIKPNVFTKVTNYYNWIMKHTGIKYNDSA